MNKYRLTKKSMSYGPGKRLYRIKALKSFGNVKKGQLGGFVESEQNLRQDGNCWIHADAKVHGEAHVWDNAQISGNSDIHGNASVSDDSYISGDAMIFDWARISGGVRISHNARVYGHTHVCGNAQLCGNAHVVGNAEIRGGIWQISPLYIQGSRNSLVTASPSTIRIGIHMTNTIEGWVKNYKEILSEYEYTKDEIAEYKEHIDHAISWLHRAIKRGSVCYN